MVAMQTGVVQSFSGWRLTCTGGQGGTHILQSPSGDKYTLGLKILNNNMEWTLGGVGYATQTFTATRRDDRNGNWLTYAYANYGSPVARPQLSSISSSDGRSLSFSYQSIAGETRLTQISSNDGATWQYQYDTLGQLDAHIDPAGRAWRYDYFPQVAYDNSRPLGSGLPTHNQPEWAKSGHLQSITLPTSGVVSFNYQPSEVWGRGVWWWEGMMPEEMEQYANSSCNDYCGEMLDIRLNWSVRTTQKVTSDGGTWNYSYVPSKTNGAYDITTIQTPSGTETYKFVGEGYFLNSSAWTSKQGVSVFYYQWGSTSGSGDITLPIIRNAWKLGTLVEKTVGPEVSTYEWAPFQHSAIYYQATSGFAGLRDEVTYRPVLSRLTKVVNGASHVTTYANFDSYGSPTTITAAGPNGGNRTTTVTYLNDTIKWILGVTKDETFNGGSTTRSFSATGNLLSQTVDGVTFSQTYDSEGNVATRTFPRGLTHYYSNYKRGIAQTETQPEGIAIARTVNDAGDVTSLTNGEGKITQFTYDGIHRVTSTTFPSGNPQNATYSSNSSITTRGALVNLAQLDAFGRVSSVSIGGVAVTYNYDPLGRLIFQSNPGESVGTSYLFDQLDRPTRVTRPDATYQTYVYGASTTTITDENNRATTYTYRAYGDPTQQYLTSIATPIAAASISIGLNARNLINSVTQDGITRTYGYNSNYYLTSIYNPETGTTTLGRDEAGNLTSRSTGASGTTTYAYDGQNRQISASYPGSTPGVARTFNKTNRVLTANSANGNRAYTYDGNGNILSETLSIDGYSFVATHSYNSNDQLVSTSYPRSNNSISYSPDVLGRPTQVSGFVTNIAYWPSSIIKSIAYANGVQTNYTVNSRLWPSNFLTQKTGGATYFNSSYSYDGTGNLTAIGDSIDSGNNRSLGYDGIDRVTTANGPWGLGSIAYSGGGNITSQSLGALSLSYSYDSSNRLNSVSGYRSASYSYDAYGNVTSAGGNSYTFDDASNLRCINCSNVSTKVEYGYDGDNHRSYTIKAGVKTYEMHASNGNLLIQFTPSQSNKLVEYMYIGNKRIADRVTP